MSESTPIPATILAEFLQALDSGVSETDLVAARPEFAAELDRLLALRARLGERRAPDPQPATYEAGRAALLASLALPPAVTPGRRPLLATVRGLLAAGWLRPRLVRAAAAGLLVFVLAGGALGASAAAGVDQARDALSALHIARSAPAPTQVPPAVDQNASPNSSGGAQEPAAAGADVGASSGDQNAGSAASDPGGEGTGCPNDINASEAERHRSEGAGCPSTAETPPASLPDAAPSQGSSDSKPTHQSEGGSDAAPQRERGPDSEPHSTEAPNEGTPVSPHHPD